MADKHIKAEKREQGKSEQEHIGKDKNGSATKVQDLAKAGRKNFDPNEGSD